jgi:integrase
MRPCLRCPEVTTSAATIPASTLDSVVGPAKELRDLAATAYGREYQLGLLIDTLAITGARPSQAVRLRVAHDAEVCKGRR